MVSQHGSYNPSRLFSPVIGANPSTTISMPDANSLDGVLDA